LAFKYIAQMFTLMGSKCFPVHCTLISLSFDAV